MQTSRLQYTLQYSGVFQTAHSVIRIQAVACVLIISAPAELCNCKLLSPIPIPRVRQIHHSGGEMEANERRAASWKLPSGCLGDICAYSGMALNSSFRLPMGSVTGKYSRPMALL